MIEYLEFVELLNSTGQKTKKWIINNKQHHIEIGIIKWAGNFRKYAFFPGINTFYDSKCLECIAEFCKEQTDLHLNKGKDKENFCA